LPPTGQLLFEGGEDLLAIGAILRRLLRVEAHDVAPVLDLDLLDLQVLAHELVAPGPGQDLVPHLPDAAHLHAHDALKPQRLQRGQVLGRHHPPVAHHHDPLNGEPLPEQVGDDGHAGDVGRVPRPHLAGDRQAIPPHQDPQDHLRMIRAVILRLAQPSQPLGAAASRYRLVVSKNTRSRGWV
jgi:hypothetical protein